MYRNIDSGFLVLPDDLQAYAWSAPMRDLAAQIGISDVGLKKFLKAQGIVAPPQGYWNKVHAGRAVPKRPRIPPRRPGATGRIHLDVRFRGHLPETKRISVDGPFASAAVPEDLEELRAKELKAIGRAAVPRNLDRPHHGLIKLLKREVQKREKARDRSWYWDGPVFDTPLGQRQLRLLNALFHALERRGHSGGAWEHNRELDAHCTIGDTTLGLSFKIVGKYRTETISGYQCPARDLPASTPLCLSLRRKFRTDINAAWQDDAAGKLEAKLATIAADVIVAGEASFRQSLIEAIEEEEQRRKWEEERRQRHIAELETRRIEDLKASGALLSQAEEIRTLVARVKAAVEAGQEIEIPHGQLTKWEVWALEQADRIDPVISGQVLSHLHVPELDE